MIYTKVKARNKPDRIWEGVQKKEFLKRSTSPPFTHLKPHLPPPAPAHAPRVAAPNVPVGVWSPTPRGRPAVALIELKHTKTGSTFLRLFNHELLSCFLESMRQLSITTVLYYWF